MTESPLLNPSFFRRGPEGGGDLQDSLTRLERTVTGAPGSELAVPLAVLREDSPYFRGSTTRVVSTDFMTATQGLLIPSSAGASAAPLDSFKVFLTFEEAFGRRVPRSAVPEWLRERNVLQILRACAALLVIYQEPSTHQARLGAALAGFFAEPYCTRMRNLVRSGRIFVVPQSVLRLAKLALGLLKIWLSLPVWCVRPRERLR